MNNAERSELQARARRRKIARADAMRAEIVLLAANGIPTWRSRTGLGSRVSLWRRCAGGLGAPRKIGDEKITEVVTTTLETMPASPDAGPWVTR